MRSFARDFSSSRRAPPKAASNPYLSSACFSASVFITSVCTTEPLSKGLIPRASPSSFTCTSRLSPCSSAMRSRKAYMSWNFQVVSTWRNGNGGGAGQKAFSARRSMTELSFPIE